MELPGITFAPSYPPMRSLLIQKLKSQAIINSSQFGALTEQEDFQVHINLKLR